MLFLFFFIAFADCFSISSINSSNLTFTAEKKLLSCSNLPPVTIYSCFLSKFPSENINNRTNDANLQWIGTTKSSFEAEFGQIKPAKFAFLQLENVDTIGEIIWNGAKIGNVRNSFRKYLFDVSKTINPTNQLQIDLQAPVIAAKQAAEAQYPIKQYPECPVSAQTNGQCHVNMLRKPQYSFSWDWGPSMPDSGIYDSPKLLVFDSSAIFDAKLQLLSAFSDELQILQVQVLILHPNSESAPAGQAIVNFKPALKFSEDAMKFEKVDENLWKGTMNLQIEREEINWWWIHGMGKQNLYTATITWDSSSSEISSIEKQFGFRTAELVQDQLQDGLSFYFKINEKPTFMSGSNWIPSSSYIGDFSDYYADNLQSAVDAGIKMLRVWGGGIYEQDAFYSKANELGLLIWQDFTFACSTYENDDAFLNSVAKEVSDQIWRLSSNPSIVAWAGNNENEAALATNWWSIPDEEMDFYYKQYSDLYIDTVQKTVLREGLTVPFVLSSPSNGKMSENSPNGIAKNPYDPNFGDVHFYDYKSDCTDWTKFPKTRFASEFGYQSWGLISSIESVTSSADRYFGSAWATQRNHHQDGNEQIYGFITQIFGEQPWIKNQSEEAFKNFIYLSQTVQSICTSSQANFYRSRAGLQSTMGALYWQLNDVWSTASWSSLDYSKNWKPLHYQIKKSFNSELTLIAKVNENDQLEVFVISDYVSTKGRLKVQTRSWRSFDTLGEVDYGMFEIKQLEGNLILTKNVGFLLNQMNCPYGKWNECYFTISFITNDGLTLFTTWESPVPIREIKVFTELDANVAFFGDCSIDPKDQSLEFEITSALPQPFIWLETRYIGRWSDNFFMMTSSRSFLTFMPAYELTCEEFMKDARIYYPSKVLVPPPKPSEVNSMKNIFMIFAITMLSIVVLSCCLICYYASREETVQQSRNLKFGNIAPRIGQRKKYRQL